MKRRTLLTAVVGAPLVVALGRLAAPARPRPAAAGPGERIAIPGARAIDHAGFTVPDLEQAIAFFTEVFGAAVLWRSAPFSADGRSPKVPAGANADPRALARLAMLRLGPGLNVELLEFRIPGVLPPPMPLASGLNVGHFAFDVDDMQAAGAYLQTKNVQMLAGPRHNTEGPNAGQDSWFFLTPWGMALELVRRPPAMPYEQSTDARLFKAPAQSPAALVPLLLLPPAAPAPENVILQLENERVRALLTRDYAAMNRLLAADGVHVESGGTARTTAEFLADFKAGKSRFEAFVIEENRVRFYGPTAVVTGRYRNVVRVNGQLQPLKRARHTRVWVRQADDVWRLVSHQATEIRAAKNVAP